MSSGYFPLAKEREAGQKLTQAIKLIQEVIDQFWESVYSGEDGQFDNSGWDGGELALLVMARGILEKRIEK